MASTVAVLGTGIMGGAMARNLNDSGMRVRVWNRTRSKAEALADGGVTVSDTPAEAADGADFLLTMLADTDSTAQAAHSALDSLPEGALWIQSGTVGVEGAELLAQQARSKGVTFVDAPVLGTKQPAEAGKLVVLAGGPEEAREKAQPVFDVIGSKTLWAGQAGMGSRLKLVANEWVIGLLATLGETLAVSKDLGVDPQDFLAAIEGGPLDSDYAQLKSKMMLSGDYPASAPLKHIRKDAALISEAAEVPTLVAEAAARYFDVALEAGHGDDDMAAIHEGVLGSRHD